MQSQLNMLGRIAGYLGILVCAGAIAGRFYGGPEFLGRQPSDVCLAGIALIVAGCFLRLDNGSTETKSASTPEQPLSS